MDSLNDLLLNKDFDEPPEIAAVKGYVKRTFNEDVSVMVKPDSIIITVGSSSLANALRLKTIQLQKVTQTKKRLVFRIA